MYCTSCGSKVVDGAAFCSSCGATVTRVAQAPRPTNRTQSDLTSELKASVEARRELGPDMEDHLIESFLTHLDGQITSRVDDEVARRIPPDARSGGRRGKGGGAHNFPEPVLVVGGSMALSIPLLNAAGGGAASIPVMIGVVLINMFYFIFRHQ